MIKTANDQMKENSDLYDQLSTEFAEQSDYESKYAHFDNMLPVNGEQYSKLNSYGISMMGSEKEAQAAAAVSAMGTVVAAVIMGLVGGAKLLAEYGPAVIKILKDRKKRADEIKEQDVKDALAEARSKKGDDGKVEEKVATKIKRQKVAQETFIEYDPTPAQPQAKKQPVVKKQPRKQTPRQPVDPTNFMQESMLVVGDPVEQQIQTPTKAASCEKV